MGAMAASFDWTAAAVITAAAGAAVAAIIAVVALLVQMRALNRQLRSANYQQIVGMFTDFSKLIVDDPELEPLIYGKPYQEPPNEHLRHKVDWVIGIRFGWFESVVIQRNHYGLLSRDIADFWIDLLNREIDAPAIRRNWERSAAWYHPDLRAEVDALLQAKPVAESDRLSARAAATPDPPRTSHR
jgi:hypothetical protein